MQLRLPSLLASPSNAPTPKAQIVEDIVGAHAESTSPASTQSVDPTFWKTQIAPTPSGQDHGSLNLNERKRSKSDLNNHRPLSRRFSITRLRKTRSVPEGMNLSAVHESWAGVKVLGQPPVPKPPAELNIDIRVPPRVHSMPLKSVSRQTHHSRPISATAAASAPPPKIQVENQKTVLQSSPRPSDTRKGHPIRSEQPQKNLDTHVPQLPRLPASNRISWNIPNLTLQIPERGKKPTGFPLDVDGSADQPSSKPASSVRPLKHVTFSTVNEIIPSVPPGTTINPRLSLKHHQSWSAVFMLNTPPILPSCPQVARKSILRTTAFPHVASHPSEEQQETGSRAHLQVIPTMEKNLTRLPRSKSGRPLRKTQPLPASSVPPPAPQPVPISKPARHPITIQSPRATLSRAPSTPPPSRNEHPHISLTVRPRAPLRYASKQDELTRSPRPREISSPHSSDTSPSGSFVSSSDEERDGTFRTVTLNAPMRVSRPQESADLPSMKSHALEDEGILPSKSAVRRSRSTREGAWLKRGSIYGALSSPPPVPPLPKDVNVWRDCVNV